MTKLHLIAVAALATFAFTGCPKGEEKAAAPKSSTQPISPPAGQPPQAAPLPPPPAQPLTPKLDETLPEELYATIKTNKGDIVVKLFPKDAPKTVANFVGLAKGTIEWRDPRSGQMQKKPLYDGTIFHRVIPGFMIQGGDPLGQGFGGPGYKFEDEFQSKRSFDKKGLLAMANAGPNTNGSQFFITTSTPEHLTGRHTIFGEVISGYEVVEAIGNAPRDRRDKPLEPITIQTIQVSETRP